MNSKLKDVEPENKRLARYRLYVDESGDHTYKLLDDPSHRYLALIGVWLKLKPDYVEFSRKLVEFKDDVFGARPDKPVVLHRSDLIGRKGPFGLLNDDNLRAKFDDDLLSLIGQTEFKVACVVIDKKAHLERYSSPFHPYHYCLAALLDRYSGWLNYKNAVGDVMAEARGGEEDHQLREAYVRVYSSGTLMFTHEHHQRVLTSNKIKIKEKRLNIAGLQLADVLAHPMKQEMLTEKGMITDPGNVFGKRIMEAVRKKINRNEWTLKIDGYGKIWL